jgi:hypothetical protein
MSALDTARQTVTEIEATSYWATCKNRPTTHLYKAHTAAMQTVAALTPAPTPDPVPVPTPPPGLPKIGLALGFMLNSRTPAAQDAEIWHAVQVGAKAARLDRPTTAVIDKLVAARIEPIYVLRGDTPTPGTIGTTAAFALYCASAANNYKGKVRIFEVLNEPDLHGWTADTYAPYLVAASKAIKDANPAAIVLHGGLWKGAGGPIEWMKRLYQLGAGPSFDAVNLHLYDDPAEHGSWSMWDMAFGSGGRGFFDAENVRSVMNTNGDAAKPIISTESGGPRAKYGATKQATIVANALATVDGIGTGNRKLAMCLIYSLLDDDGLPADAGYGIAGQPAESAFTTAPALTLSDAARMMREAVKDRSYRATPLGLEVARYYRWKKNEWGAQKETLRDYEAILAKTALYHSPTSNYRLRAARRAGAPPRVLGSLLGRQVTADTRRRSAPSGSTSSSGQVRLVPIPDDHFWGDLLHFKIQTGVGPDSYILYRTDTRRVMCSPAEAEEVLDVGNGRTNYYKTRTVRNHSRPVAGKTAHQWWYRCLNRAGIEDTTGMNMHRGRHTVATEILRKTGNIVAAQMLLGHSSIETTVRSYAQADIGQLADIMRSMRGGD